MVESGVYRHQSVLSQEAVSGLVPASGGRYVDATFGGGGHALAILEASAPDGLVIGLDRDADALHHATPLVQRFPTRLKLIHSPFSQLGTILESLQVPAVHGILFDLGVSSWQLDQSERGFSFMRDGPLDMRMDQQQPTTAAQLVNTLPEGELANLIFQLGEERHSRRLARAIVHDRRQNPFTTTRQLASLAERVIPGRSPIHPATRTFQALRMAVNGELEELQTALEQAYNALLPGGRMAVISFHSLEDRMVKQFFQNLARPPLPPGCDPRTPDPPSRLRILTRKPVVANEEEVNRNPRARSAKLRIGERLIPGEAAA
ncbi:MAG: 16S rRNA (cytosine(1402)-N(4))-methyltransferase RsmH [Magnetococcales bacterium]|nr:16S rRNA (cytosine(1402)-N(4))-methyltransferase RsmH [Magnetococcales bacterium]NGZ28548.1 16S rRNA (cytosine(1402)-N(4))-methyltransferase RsmH [Magnetococcales bacterium]